MLHATKELEIAHCHGDVSCSMLREERLTLSYSQTEDDSNLVHVLSLIDLHCFYQAGFVPNCGLQDAYLLLLHNMIDVFTLNTEQLRAFLIIA